MCLLRLRDTFYSFGYNPTINAHIQWLRPYMINGTTIFKLHGFWGHSWPPNVCKLKVHTESQGKGHWATTLITRALTAPCDTETSSTSQALLRTQTVKVKEDKPCYAPSLHKDISVCVCVHVCVKGVWQVFEGAYKIITLHSTQILYWAARAHIFHRHYFQHSQADRHEK